MDAIRKQLDVLMGANRNGDVTEVNRKYYDRDVCRLFLVGLCPHELFQLTKMDMGPCPKLHSLQLMREYEEAKAKGLDNYDRDLEDVIDRLIVECDRKITRALKRLEDEDAKAAIAISVSEVTQSMLLLDAFNKDRASLPQPLTNPPPLAPLPVVAPDAHTQEMINEKLKKAEDLGKWVYGCGTHFAKFCSIYGNGVEFCHFNSRCRCSKEMVDLVHLGMHEGPTHLNFGEQGMVDEAQKALEEAEALRKLAPRTEPVTDSSKYTAADVRITDQKLRVCDICGAFLSVYDRRLLGPVFGG